MLDSLFGPDYHPNFGLFHRSSQDELAYHPLLHGHVQCHHSLQCEPPLTRGSDIVLLTEKQVHLLRHSSRLEGLGFMQI